MKRPVHFIVVDDETAMEVLFEAFFEEKIDSSEVRFSYFDNAKKCLEFLEKNHQDVDLIFSDINMPVMNGYEFLDQLKLKFPTIKVYMISAYGSDDYIKKAQDKGAEGFFVKPFDFDELIEVVDKISWG